MGFLPTTAMLYRGSRSHWREFGYAFQQVKHAIEPTLSLRSMLKNWKVVVRGLAESPRKRITQECRFPKKG
jgi:hypothetical protein